MVGGVDDIMQMRPDDAWSKTFQPLTARIKPQAVQSFGMTRIQNKTDPGGTGKIKQELEFIRTGMFEVMVAILDPKTNAQRLRVCQ